jgi:hypothetical protein
MNFISSNKSEDLAGLLDAVVSVLITALLEASPKDGIGFSSNIRCSILLCDQPCQRVQDPFAAMRLSTFP